MFKRLFLWCLICCGLLLSASTLWAQNSSVLVIDGQRLYIDSRFAQILRDESLQKRRELNAEFITIQNELQAEELALTEARKTMNAEEFQDLATAFDEKSQSIRATQDARTRASDRELQRKRQDFFERIAPVIATLMADMQATVILEKANVLYSLNVIDITDQAIERIDAFFVLNAPQEEAQ